MIEQSTIEAMVAKALERQQAEYAAAREADRVAAEQKAKEWRDAVAPIAVSCGARPLAIQHLVDRASALFELRAGKVVAKPGVMHPRDPCTDMDPITWLADLRNGEDGDLLFQK
jgi:hypothetical protein